MIVKRFMTFWLLLSLVWTTSCEILPVTRYKPTLHNPFPQLATVAVLPFYNFTNNDSVNGRDFANCYANELQRVDCFRVISNKLVEETMLQNNLQQPKTVDDLRYLAQLLKVDAVIIGKIHDFSGYYPPRVKLEVEWYAANPFFHPIPAGRDLPWGTEHEGSIPDKVVLMAEMELAKAQLATQTPFYEPVTPIDPNSSDGQDNWHTDTRTGKSGDSSSEKRAREKVAKENPIRLAAGSYSGLGNMTPNDETALEDEAIYRQEQFVNRNLATTGVPFIPNATPISDADKKKAALEPDPSMPHPLDRGPWKSDWAMQNQSQLSQQNMKNPGTYQGHYQGFPAPNDLTPEQLAQFGWAPESIAALPNYYAQMPGMPIPGSMISSQTGPAGEIGPGGQLRVMGEPTQYPGLPADWPDPRGMIPEGPTAVRPKGEIKSDAPVLYHIAIYNGNDSHFMQALQDYDFLFRDDRRLAGKQSILNNRTEFVSFCCRLHIWEMLGARGGIGAAEKVVREWKVWQGEKPY
ncbi:MAG: hypothetical protein ACRCUY_08680 [Thermoguttaceae bacterium]